MTIERRGAGHALAPCPQCGGDGWLQETGMGHDCGGDERLCYQRCPIPEPIQVACEACGGSGEVQA